MTTKYEFKVIPSSSFEGMKAVLAALDEAGRLGFAVVTSLDTHILLQREMVEH